MGEEMTLEGPEMAALTLSDPAADAPMEPVAEDRQKITYPDMVQWLNGHARARNLVFHAPAGEEKACRYMVWKRHTFMVHGAPRDMYVTPVVDERAQEPDTPLTVGEWVRRVTASDAPDIHYVMCMKPGCMETVTQCWANFRDQRGMPMYYMNGKRIAFNDGVFDLPTCAFIPWAELPPAHECQMVIPFRYYEKPFPHEPDLTMYDQILKYQGISPATRFWMLAIFGHFFFRLTLAEGRQAIIPWLYGASRSGKSVIGSMVKEMFGPGMAGSWNPEVSSKAFPMEPLYRLFFAICDEMTKQMSVPVTAMKTISTGGTVTMNIKGQQQREWVARLWCFFIGNFPIGDVDGASSAIGQRICYFYFGKTLPAEERDPEMVKRFIASGCAGDLTVAAVRAYHQAKYKWPARDWTSVMSKQMRYWVDVLHFSKHASTVDLFLRARLQTGPTVAKQHVSTKDIITEYANFIRTNGFEAEMNIDKWDKAWTHVIIHRLGCTMGAYKMNDDSGLVQEGVGGCQLLATERDIPALRRRRNLLEMAAGEASPMEPVIAV